MAVLIRKHLIEWMQKCEVDREKVKGRVYRIDQKCEVDWKSQGRSLLNGRKNAKLIWKKSCLGQARRGLVLVAVSIRKSLMGETQKCEVDWEKVKGKSLSNRRKNAKLVWEKSCLGQARRGLVLVAVSIRKSLIEWMQKCEVDWKMVKGKVAKMRSWLRKSQGKSLLNRCKNAKLIEKKPQHLGFPCGPPPWY